MYVDGLNLYGYAENNPAARTDANGTQAERSKYHIEVTFIKRHREIYEQVTELGNGNFRFAMGISVDVTLVANNAYDQAMLWTCPLHLIQDTEAHTSWPNQLGEYHWKTFRDYSPDKENRLYHDYWFEDDPSVRIEFQPNQVKPGQIDSIWWQAHVYVQENPKIETWYGYAGSVRWGDSKNKVKDQVSKTTWAGAERHWFVPDPSLDNFGRKKAP